MVPTGGVVSERGCYVVIVTAAASSSIGFVTFSFGDAFFTVDHRTYAHHATTAVTSSASSASSAV